MYDLGSEELLEKVHKFKDYLVDISNADPSVKRAQIKLHTARLEEVEQKEDAPEINHSELPMTCTSKSCPLRCGDGNSTFSRELFLCE